MSTIELIDKAIEHCKKCRPNESGHGVTLALLNEIKQGIESGISATLTLEQKMMNAICDNTDVHVWDEGDSGITTCIQGRPQAAKACAEIADSELKAAKEEITKLTRRIEEQRGYFANYEKMQKDDEEEIAQKDAEIERLKKELDAAKGVVFKNITKELVEYTKPPFQYLAKHLSIVNSKGDGIIDIRSLGGKYDIELDQLGLVMTVFLNRYFTPPTE
jgi:hypothetical protein